MLFTFTVDFHHCVKTNFQRQPKTNSYGVLNPDGHNLQENFLSKPLSMYKLQSKVSKDYSSVRS